MECLGHQLISYHNWTKRKIHRKHFHFIKMVDREKIVNLSSAPITLNFQYPYCKSLRIVFCLNRLAFSKLNCKSLSIVFFSGRYWVSATLPELVVTGSAWTTSLATRCCRCYWPHRTTTCLRTRPSARVPPVTTRPQPLWVPVLQCIQS